VEDCAGVAAGSEAPKVCPETPHRRALQAREKMSEDCAGARWWGEAPKVCPETLTGVHYKQERR
jgi:hypothetical protein